jgi:hypothetical protein
MRGVERVHQPGCIHLRVELRCNRSESAYLHFMGREAFELAIQALISGTGYTLGCRNVFLRAPPVDREIAAGNLLVLEKFGAEITVGCFEQNSPCASRSMRLREGRLMFTGDAELRDNQVHD